MPRKDLIQIRRGTAADWTSKNSILENGEFGFETDTGKLKCGDGSSTWVELGYVSSDVSLQTNPVENEYADITALLADQGNQTETFFQYVIDASADPNVASGDAYYEKLATSTTTLAADYRLLSDTETQIITDSNGYRVFRIQYIQDDSSPNDTANGGRIGFNYDTGTDKVTSVVFNNIYSDALDIFYAQRASNTYKLKFYNRNTGVYSFATVTGWTVNGNYYIVDVDSGIDISEISVNNRIELFFEIDNGADANITIESDITANTTISGTQKGLYNIYPVNNSADRTITVDKGTYAVGDVVNFMRKGEGAVTIDRGTNVRLQGARNIDNVFKIKDVGGYASVIFEYLDGSTLVASVIGDIERGYTGAVTTSSYSNLESNETANVTVAGTGFSDNMLVTLSGNATLNSYTVNSNTSLTLNITSSGTDGDFLTVTYDNGQVFEDTNAIQLTDIAPVSVVIETTSTSATWSPTNVNNSGSTLTWTVTGDASGTYNANDPTIDLSGNVGTAIITITSADDLAGWTTARFTSLNITSADVTNWTACTELWFVTNGGAFTTLTGAENLVNATKFDLRSSGFTSFSVPTGSTLTELQLDFCINLTTITNLANATGLQILDINNTPISSIDLSTNTALTALTASTCTSLSSITGLANLTSLTSLNIALSNFSTIDVDANNALTSLSIQGNSLSVSSINNVIIDLDAAGLSSGTLNYSSQSPTANPTATEVSTDDVLNAYNSLVGKSWTITGATPA